MSAVKKFYCLLRRANDSIKSAKKVLWYFMQFLESVIKGLAVVWCFGAFNIDASSIDAERTIHGNEASAFTLGILFGNVPSVVDFPHEDVFSVSNFLTGSQEERDKILEDALREKLFPNIFDPFWRTFFIIAANRDPISTIRDFDGDYVEQSIMNLLSGKTIVCKVKVLHGPLSKMLKPGSKVFCGEEIEDVTHQFHGTLSVDLTTRIMHNLLPKLDDISNTHYQECVTKVRSLTQKVDNNQYGEVENEAADVYRSLMMANRADKQPELVSLIRNLVYCCEMITGSFSRESLRIQNLVTLFPDAAEYMGFRVPRKK
jgi:hypothetical protein